MFLKEFLQTLLKKSADDIKMMTNYPACKLGTKLENNFCCKIEISHPRGRNFNQGQGLPSPWLNSDPKGDISLPYMVRLDHDGLFFFPLFQVFLSEHKKLKKKREHFNFLINVLHYF